MSCCPSNCSPSCAPIGSARICNTWYSLHHPRRRHLAGGRTLDSMPSRVLPAGPRPLAPIPASVLGAHGGAGPKQVLGYLARYTHRVAIANSRLISLSAGKVRFRWKDYREDGHSKVMTLKAGEFIRRFLLHTLPDGFHRIRHFGLFANGHRADKLVLCRKLLEVPPTSAEYDADQHGLLDNNPPPCPCCGGHMRIIETFDGPLSRPYHVRRFDSS